MRGRWDAKNSPRDYGIARNLRSGLKNPIGDPRCSQSIKIGVNQVIFID